MAIKNDKATAAVGADAGVTAATGAADPFAGLGLEGFKDYSLEMFFWRAREAKSPLVGSIVATIEGIETKYSKDAKEDEDKTMQCAIVKLSRPAVWEDSNGKTVTAETGTFVRVPTNNGQLRDLHRRAKIAIAQGKAIGIALAFTGTEPTPKGKQNQFKCQLQDAALWADIKTVAPEMIGFDAQAEVPQFETAPVAAKQLTNGAGASA